MQRIKTIDLFRGISVIIFVIYHMFDWWLEPEIRSEVFIYLGPFIGRVFGPSFVFIAGVSTYISYNNRMEKVSSEFPYSRIRNEYIFRAFLILLLGFLYNLVIAIATLEFYRIWTWFMLFSIGFSLFMTWPLLKTAKSLRIIIAGIILLLNNVAYVLLSPFEFQANIAGIAYFLLFHSIDLDPLFSVFPFMLIGTVLGQELTEIYNVDDNNIRKSKTIKEILIPCLISSGFLILVTFSFLYDYYIQNMGFSWILYSLGFSLLLFSIPLYLEQQGYFDKKRSYRFLYYFSFYSLTVYLSHNLLFLFFNHSLTLLLFFVFSIPLIILYGFLLRWVYKKWGAKFAIKAQIGKIASSWAERIEKRRNIDI